MEPGKSLNTILLKTILEKINSIETNQKKSQDRKSHRENKNSPLIHKTKSSSQLYQKKITFDLNPKSPISIKSFLSKNLREKIFKLKSVEKSPVRKSPEIKLKKLEKFLNENSFSKIPKIQIYFS